MIANARKLKRSPGLFQHKIFVLHSIVIVTICIITDNRTYHFQADDESEQRAWTSVLVNCKEGALMRAFHQQVGGESNDSGHSLLDLQRSIIRAVKAMPGNQVCADCGSTNGKFLRNQLFLKRAQSIAYPVRFEPTY